MSCPPPLQAPRPGVSGAPSPSAGGFPVHSASSPQRSFPGEGVLPAAVRLLIYPGSTPDLLSSYLLPRAGVSHSHYRRQGAANQGLEPRYACAKPLQLQHSAPQRQPDRGWVGLMVMVTTLAEDWNLVPDTCVKWLTIACTPASGDLAPSFGIPRHTQARMYTR